MKPARSFGTSNKASFFIQRRPFSFFPQRAAFTTSSQGAHPFIATLYHRLLNQAASPEPLPCNFVSQVVDHWAQEKTRLALHCMDVEKGEESFITYAELVKRSHQVARFLTQTQGLKKGQTVALMLGQRPAWWYALAGLFRAGIAAVPCPRLLTSQDLLYRFNDLEIDGIITAPELESRLDAIKESCPSLKTRITTGAAHGDWIAMETILGKEVLPYEANTTTVDPSIYLYTSGTTGQPKAVQHNADYPFFHWPTGNRWLKASGDDLIYNASDTGWGFTVWITMAAWSMGAPLLITPSNQKFKPEQLLTLLQDKPITIFCAAPTVLRLLAAHPQFARIQFPALKRIVTVGEALDETVIQRFAEKGVEIAVGFGQAETPLLIGRVDERPHQPGTMGQPIDPYKVVLLDDELQPLPAGKVGQIAVDLVEGKSAGIMRGYAKAPEKTQKAHSPDKRYYLTGDYAQLGADQFFVYQGRRDDLIKSRGYRIGPDEVEKAGMSHPAIAKIAVVGIRTSLESVAITVKAFVLLKPGYSESTALVEEIQAHIKRETGPYKYPRLVEVLSLAEWEQYETTSGKIRRAGLREREEKKLLAALDAEKILSPSPTPAFSF